MVSQLFDNEYFMKKSKFNHPFAFDPLVCGSERVDGRSETIPGRALSIAEIMQRSAAGIPVPAGPGLEYGDDEDFDHAFETDDPLIDAADAAERSAALRAQIEDKAREAQAKLKHQDPEIKDAEPTSPQEQ